MRRLASVTASIALATLLAACAVPPPTPPLPVVLVHGACSDARVWDRVAAELRARGRAVTAVNLPCHGQDDPQRHTPATIARDGLVEVFCADGSPADQQDLPTRHRAEAVPPLGTAETLAATRFGRVPRTHVPTSEDRAVSQQMVAAAGGASPVITLRTSHMPMLTQPRALAEAIVATTT